MTDTKQVRTPGPWKEGYDDGEGRGSVITKDGLLIADVTFGHAGDGPFIVEACNAHDQLVADKAALVKALTSAIHALRSYECGNVATDLAREIADECQRALAATGEQA